MSQSTTIEVEVKGNNKNLLFEPLDRILRGELDFQKIKEPQARLMGDRWPTPIPGVRLAVDTKEQTGKVIDPLHWDDHKPTREQIEKDFRLGPPEETVEKIDMSTWIDRMQRAVDAGHAKLTKGQFPATLPNKPTQRFLTMDEETPAEKQEKTMDRLARALDKLADKLGVDWEE